MYETFDHTADLGLRICAADLDTLFAEAGLALLTALVENPQAVGDDVTFTVELPADDLEYLLFDWLRALLMKFEMERVLSSRFEVRVGDGVTATVWGENYDPSRHEPAHEVKAITYHDLRAEKTADGYLAEVIIDI